MTDFPNAFSSPSVILGTPQSMAAVLAGAVVRGAAAWPSANLAIFIPVPVNDPITVVKLMANNGATATGNIDAGIYTPTGKRVVSIGTTAMAGTNAMQTFDIADTLLNPGLYYLGLALSSASGENNSWAPSTSLARSSGVMQMASALPLPDPATFAALAFNYVPMVAATTRTTI